MKTRADTRLPETTRVRELHAYDGTRESLKLVETPAPEPGKGDVLVKITAAPMNLSDLMLLRGEHGTRKNMSEGKVLFMPALRRQGEV